MQSERVGRWWQGRMEGCEEEADVKLLTMIF